MMAYIGMYIFTGQENSELRYLAWRFREAQHHQRPNSLPDDYIVIIPYIYFIFSCNKLEEPIIIFLS